MKRPARRRGAKTAPARCTPDALELLYAYVQGSRNRKRAVSVALGCSTRTAGRILSCRNPYRAPLRMAWVERLCHLTGKSLVDVIGAKAPKTVRQCVSGWTGATSNAEAIQAAIDCATAVVNKAMTYGLSGTMAVDFEGGFPREVAVSLSTVPDVKALGGDYSPDVIAITREKLPDGSFRMMMKHVWPGVPIPDRMVLTPELLEHTLRTIHERTKRISRNLARRAAGPRHASGLSGARH